MANVRAVPSLSQKSIEEHVAARVGVLQNELTPRLEAAQAERDTSSSWMRLDFAAVWNISVLPVVLHAAVGTSRVGTAAIQRTGSLECHNPATDLRGECDGREHRYDVRIVAEDCRPKSDRSDHGRAGQRPLSEERGGAKTGHGPPDITLLYLPSYSKSKPDRTTLEVHQTPNWLWPLSPSIRRLSGRHPGHHQPTYQPHAHHNWPLS